jgi:hypothetical protein
MISDLRLANPQPVHNNSTTAIKSTNPHWERRSPGRMVDTGELEVGSGCPGDLPVAPSVMVSRYLATFCFPPISVCLSDNVIIFDRQVLDVVRACRSGCLRGPGTAPAQGTNRTHVGSTPLDNQPFHRVNHLLGWERKSFENVGENAMRARRLDSESRQDNCDHRGFQSLVEVSRVTFALQSPSSGDCLRCVVFYLS